MSANSYSRYHLIWCIYNGIAEDRLGIPSPAMLSWPKDAQGK